MRQSDGEELSEKLRNEVYRYFEFGGRWEMSRKVELEAHDFFKSIREKRMMKVRISNQTEEWEVWIYSYDINELARKYGEKAQFYRAIEEGRIHRIEVIEIAESEEMECLRSTGI